MRLVQGICDGYYVNECVNIITNEKCLEVYDLNHKYLFDIDGDNRSSDEEILNEIDAHED